VNGLVAWTFNGGNDERILEISSFVLWRWKTVHRAFHTWTS